MPTLAERATALTGRPFRFLVVGAWNTAFGYLAYAAFYKLFALFGWSYLWATVPAQALAIVNAWYFQRRFVFGTEAKVATSFVRFSLVYWSLYALTVPVFALLVSGIGLHPLVAQALLLAVSVVVSYVVHSRFTFRAPKVPRGDAAEP